MDKQQVRVFPSVAELNQAASQLWLDLAEQSISQFGAFHIALSGGSTPKRLYARMAELADARLLQHTHFYFGDERCVPPEHQDSNYRMASEALFDKVDIPDANIHRILTELTPPEAARHYQHTLEEHLPKFNGIGAFDLVLLGMGEDGHTASLFPATQALNETQNWVCANEVPQLDTWRVTLSYPLLNNARQIAILAAGAGKAGVLHEIEQNSAQPPYPIQAVSAREQLHWLLDQDAASQLVLAK